MVISVETVEEKSHGSKYKACFVLRLAEGVSAVHSAAGRRNVVVMMAQSETENTNLGLEFVLVHNSFDFAHVGDYGNLLERW